MAEIRSPYDKVQAARESLNVARQAKDESAVQEPTAIHHLVELSLLWTHSTKGPGKGQRARPTISVEVGDTFTLKCQDTARITPSPATASTCYYFQAPTSQERKSLRVDRDPKELNDTIETTIQEVTSTMGAVLGGGRCPQSRCRQSQFEFSEEWENHLSAHYVQVQQDKKCNCVKEDVRCGPLRWTPTVTQAPYGIIPWVV